MSTDYREHFISSQLVKELVSIYDRKNYSYINSKRDASTPDAKEFWFPLEVIEEYIAYVKREAKNLGLKELGLKIKLGQYPEDRTIGPLQKANTKGYQTVCLIPTTKTISISAEVEEDKNTSGNQEIKGISAMNFATICPPYI